MQRLAGRIRSVAALVALAAALGAAGEAGATSANTDVTDLWWNPNEAGWGMQLVNTGTFVFATLYVYGADRQPVWYSGEMTKADAPVDRFSGPLYFANGQYFGSNSTYKPFATREVGTITFTLTDTYNGTLRYSVDGVVVNKAVQRQPLTMDDYNGTYRATLTSTRSCSGSPFGSSSTEALTVKVVQSGISMTQTWTYLANGNTCTYRGGYNQLGRMGFFDATYECSSGEKGTASLYQMNNAPGMYTARLQFNPAATGCVGNGEMAGVVPR